MSERALQLLYGAGAVITDSHFVYAFGRHGSTYVNKYAVYAHPQTIGELCGGIAAHFIENGREYDVVVGPEKGGLILSQWTAYNGYLKVKRPGEHEVLAVFVEKEGDAFVFPYGYDKLVRGKSVLVVEDVLNTGTSAKRVIEATRAIGGNVVGLGILCKRGKIQPQDIDAYLFSLTDIPLDDHDEAECPHCIRGIPINTNFGRGKEFLRKNSDKLCVCPNPKCRGLADWVDKERGIFSCRRCGATTAAMEFE